MATDSPPPPIGRYRPIIRLGAGGMADVYLAVSRTSSGLERLAVIKRLRPDIGEDPEEVLHFKGMFWDEAKLAMLLNHTNVVHTHDACEENGSLYLVMEYIEGQSLNNVQRELARSKRKLTPKQAAFIVSEILAGLHYAHELKSLSGEHLNIVHRDVSPQNILLSYDGGIKLVDFGVARSATSSTETRAGTLKGKARYMAPEQVLNQGVDRRADLYAAGVVLWEILASKKMVEGTNMVEQLVNVMKTDPERLSNVVPDVDPELEAIVHKALARTPSDRFESALAMREALVAFVKRDGDLRSSEIATLVGELFAKKREEVATVVRERLALDAQRELRGETLSTPDLHVFDESDRSMSGASGSLMSRPSTMSGMASGSSGTASVASGISSFTPPGTVQAMHPSMSPNLSAPPESKRTITFLVASLMVLLLVVGGLAGVVVSSARKEPAAAVAPPPNELRPGAEGKPATEAKPGGGAAPAPDGTPHAREDAPAAPTATVAKAADTKLVPKWSPTPAAPPRPAPPPTPAAPPPEESQGGFLTFDTYPWTKVSENGRVLGNTPLVRVPLSAGTHVLTLENPQENVKQTSTVIVKPGETVSKRLAF